jgi:hypothetical protein
MPCISACLVFTLLTICSATFQKQHHFMQAWTESNNLGAVLLLLELHLIDTHRLLRFAKNGLISVLESNGEHNTIGIDSNQSPPQPVDCLLLSSRQMHIRQCPKSYLSDHLHEMIAEIVITRTSRGLQTSSTRATVKAYILSRTM